MCVLGVYRVQGGGVSARSRKCGEVGGPWSWVGWEPYVDRTVSTITMSKIV
jgi:hypothetical protein